MTLDEFLTGTFTGTIGGLIVWISQQIYSNRREKRKAENERVVRLKHLEKIVTDSILWDLRPGANIELMRELLGPPTKQQDSDWPVFLEEEKQTYSYLYVLSNAYLKITSWNNKTIDSITALPFDNNFAIDAIVLPEGEKESFINIMRVSKDLLDVINNHTLIQTRIDSSFAIELFIPNPLYQHYTFFGSSQQENIFSYHESKDANLFLGGIVEGICISNSLESAYFIYDMEVR